MIGENNIIILDVSHSSIEDVEKLEGLLDNLDIPFHWVSEWAGRD
jgi:hypothetical protein